jgi:hypothetical protein
MSQPATPNNPLDLLGIWREARDSQIDTWSKFMIDLINSEAYAKAMGAALDAYLSNSTPYRQMLEKAFAQAIAQAQLPLRSDVTMLAERLTNIEFRLDDLDAAVAALRKPAAPSRKKAPAEGKEPS